ncbi:hypothetical protein ACA910_015750 [Epithemia clementina (nom. ined.)]
MDTESMDRTPSHGNQEDTVSGDGDQEKAQAENSSKTSRVSRSFQLLLACLVFSKHSAVQILHKLKK